jgi:hypothetical protein
LRNCVLVRGTPKRQFSCYAGEIVQDPAAHNYTYDANAKLTYDGRKGRILFDLGTRMDLGLILLGYQHTR